MSRRDDLRTANAPRIARACGLAAAGLTAAFGLGCNESGSCAGPGALDGTYVSSDPAATMTVLECDGEVSGSLVLGGVTYDVEGTRTDDAFTWSTNGVDLCDGPGVRRSAASDPPDHYVVDTEGDAFTGAFNLFESNCRTGRGFRRGFTSTFERL